MMQSYLKESIDFFAIPKQKYPFLQIDVPVYSETQEILRKNIDNLLGTRVL